MIQSVNFTSGLERTELWQVLIVIPSPDLLEFSELFFRSKLWGQSMGS